MRSWTVCRIRQRKERGIFAVGAILFLVSDIVLILNTFGRETKQSLRVTNISLYYAGQILIALSLRFLA